jgi:nicotinamidase-related amidase
MFDYLEDGNTEFNFKQGTEEVEYDSRLVRTEAISEIVKNRYSAFAGTRLSDELAKKRINKVVICGFMTNFCCESTARQAHDSDIYVDFVIDATGTPGTENIDEKKMREIVQDKMVAGIARVMSTNEWLVEQGTP